MEVLPVSVVVCTLNESVNIAECLEAVIANQPAEVIIVDAQSEDDTVAKAGIFKVLVISASRKGLAYQRHLGLEAAQYPYVAFVDADDVLDPDCLAILLEDAKTHGYTALQASSRSYHLETYWQRAMDALSSMRSTNPGPTNMVGRPALYDQASLKAVGIDAEWGRVGNEDTDLSIRFERQGMKMGRSRAGSRRKHPANLRDWLAAWSKYGRGDLKLIRKYPEKARSIIKHQLIGYPILTSAAAIRLGYGRYCPFFILFGLCRFIFMIRALVRNGSKSTIDGHTTLA